MSENKPSKLSAMAADYYPSSARSSYSDTLPYSQNISFGAYHQPSAAMSPHAMMFQPTPIPPTFQPPFVYVPPTYIDSLPNGQVHHAQQCPDGKYPAANRSGSNFSRNGSQNNKSPSHIQQSPHNKDNSAGNKSRRKKKQRKNRDCVKDLVDSVGSISMDDSNAGINVDLSSISYSDVLKRPHQTLKSKSDSRDTGADENNQGELGSSVKKSESKPLSKSQGEESSISDLQSQRGVLKIPRGALDNKAYSTRHGSSFTIDLSALATSKITNSRKQNKPSSAKVSRPKSPERMKDASQSKKGTSSLEASALLSGDSPDRKPKYSKLKKVILEERKKRMQTSTDGDDLQAKPTITEEIQSVSAVPVENPASPTESLVYKSFPTRLGSVGNTCNGYLSAALANLSKEDADAISRRLHRRRFREYCDQALGAALDDATYLLLTTLGGYQQRQYEQNPTKAKLRRRYVCGLREAIKHIQLGKAKCIILAPNIERISGKGGLDDIIGSIISECGANGVPIVFALGRVALGRACSKPSPVSSVAILSPAGAEDKFKQTLELAQRAHESYIELVKMAVAEQLEQREQNAKKSSSREKSTHPEGSSFLGQYSSDRHSHMGHTRNASNISAISFISNISAVSDNNAVGVNGSSGNINSASEDSDKDFEDDYEDDMD